MDTKTVEKIIAVISVLLIVGIILSIFKQLNKSTETKVISDKGLEALKDPEKKKKIDAAIKKAIKNQEDTGVWNDPVVDLN